MAAAGGGGGGGGGGASSVVLPSLPLPRPKSPPEYPDLYGKRREFAKVQMLEREIGFLQEELKYIEGVQPASRCIKEVADFVVANSDPLIPTSRKIRKSCRFWKWLCGKSCFNISCASCCVGCSPNLEMPSCCDCNPQCCFSCSNCSIPKCRCICWPSFRCFKKILCCRSCCCVCGRPPPCPDCSISKCICSCFKCPKLPRSSCCTVNCCYPSCCLC